MFVYEITSGKLFAADGTLAGEGYSGHPPHVNDVDAIQIPNVGPIPVGMWQAVAMRAFAPQGQFVLVLVPKAGTCTFDRSGFLMHGDLVNEPGQEEASEGCIIMPRATREAVWQSADHDINVVATIT
jgi:Protein of unknown function (DUF2778)